MKKSLLAISLCLASLVHADWTQEFNVGGPTAVPTHVKTAIPTAVPTVAPTVVVTIKPTAAPTVVHIAPAPVPAAPVTVAPVAVPTLSALGISGYVDVFGSLNTTNTDLLSNGVHFGTFQLSLKSNQGDSLREYLELGFGENATVFTSANAGPATPYVQQAYVTQGLGKFSVQAGKFIGFLGYELPDPNSNLNYTRSQIFLAEPVYNIGLVAKYALTDTTNLIAYGVNENSSDTALDGTKDVGASLQSLGDKGGFAVNWYRDNYKVVEYSHRDLINAYTYLMFGPATVAVEYLHGDLMLNAGAAYLSYASDNISVTIRGVLMNNPGTIPGDSSEQYTLTFKQKNGAVTNVVEVITDAAHASIYPNSATGSVQNNQTTLVLSTVYSF